MENPHRGPVDGPETDLATAAARTVPEATAATPAGLPDTPRAYLDWLRTPGHRTARPTAPRPGRKPLRAPAPRRQYKPRDPAYAPAAAVLATLPDLGAALIEQARTELGDAEWEALVIRAAELNGDRTP